MNPRRTSMRECPHCGTMTDAVHTCPKCEAEGCEDEDCIMTGGAGTDCISCQENATDDSGANQLISDKDDD